MRLRIDLKIFVFLVLFYFTKQIQIYLVIMFFSLIHELGHLLIGLLLKMKPESLEIMPYGLSVSFRINSKDISKNIGKANLLEIKTIIIALAGPIVSFILTILYLKIKPLYISQQDAIYANILISLFNLIPIYPLDGGRMIKGILHIYLGNIQALIKINKISNIVMIILTIISSIAVYYYKNIAIFLICIVLWTIVIQENKELRNNKKMYEILKE